MTPLMFLTLQDTQPPISEEDIPRPTRAPYGTREHARQMRADLLYLYEALCGQWYMVGAMLEDLDDFLDEDKSSQEEWND